jgi:hypothetical protein
MPRFIDFLLTQNQVGNFESEALRHEMTATLNRNRLTGQEEGIHSFNTAQLCWLVTSNPSWPADHQIVVALLLSSLIDDQLAIFRSAQDCGVLPAGWTWVAWADGFAGDEAELRERLATIGDMRQRCGAACLATAGRPGSIGTSLLGDFRYTGTAVVYHRLLGRALTGAHAAAVAAAELQRLGENLEVLFAADTDATIASLVQASTLDRPEQVVAPFKDATADFTRTAIARRHLERGRAAEALALIKDLRFLSPAFADAILVAALAALECKQFELAMGYCRNIAAADLRLKVQTRIAQATGDVAAEVDALVDLYQRHPGDAQVFVQLVTVLDRIGRHDLSRDICYRAQESFCGDPVVDGIIKRHLAASR